MRSILFYLFGAACATLSTLAAEASRRPNILIAIADDQSFDFTSRAGYPGVRTPAFDQVAREGVYFDHAFAASPGCSPSRASLLTGRHPWQNEQAGTHDSEFPKKYIAFPDLLEKAGYWIGMTGKGWGPGNWQISGRTRNPAGPEFSEFTLKAPTTGINSNDYTRNFEAFLAARPNGKPFYFWFGCREPHRPYEAGSGVRAGMKLENAPPPPFLPDSPEVRGDLLDACLEIEWFDRHLGAMLKLLEEKGELDNTIVIVTGDNGIPFPRVKGNDYEMGIHVPLAIRWPARVPGGRVVTDLVGFVDLTATILEAAGVQHPGGVSAMSGRSIMNLLTSSRSGRLDPTRTGVYAGRERHSGSRYGNLSYPQRAIRTDKFLYIRNFRPERWPAGDPIVLRKDGKPAGSHSGYRDIDPSPTLAYLIAHANDPKLGKYLQWAVAKRPAEELYDIIDDPACLHNLAASPAFAATRGSLANRLEECLRETGDPRVLNGGEIWETYKRYSPTPNFPKPNM